MSTRDEHTSDCDEVLAHLYEFIDHELADADCDTIQAHLDGCEPCLQELGLEQTVRALIRKSCSEHAPDELRSRVLLSIRQVHVRITEISD